MRKTIGEKIDGKLEIVEIRYYPNPGMAWETPHVFFTSLDGSVEYVWNLSDEHTARELESFVGAKTHVRAFNYNGSLRRVKLGCFGFEKP
jgi:hypothetical protein